MPRNVVVIGTQWGDEGKGKSLIGSPNRCTASCAFRAATMPATLVVNGSKDGAAPDSVGHAASAHHLLSRQWRRVVSPADPMKEIGELEAAGVEVRSRLKIAQYACPVVAPYHVAVDQAREAKRGDAKIGTTGRGIGPTYETRSPAAPSACTTSPSRRWK